MKLDSRVVLGFACLFVGVVVGALAVDYGYGGACPSRICVGSSEVVPVSDRGYFEALHGELVKSRESVHIASFELMYYGNYPNSSMNVIVQDLIDARRRGVDVKVVLDEYGMEGSAHDILVENGIEVRYDSNETTTHAKLVVIDGEVVILGSTNLSYFGLERNNEVDLLVRDRRVGGYFEDYFRELWGKE